MGEVELSFILPAHNEGDSIGFALDALDRVVKGSRLRYEIVVVDDGSIDSTRVKALEYASRNGHVRVVGYDRNLGKGYAIKKGFMQATGDAVVFVSQAQEV
jgi:glycosyltransferase involved in cell wall biosynthesis